MEKTAIILAGGFGTRLKNVVSDVPKPMAPINEQPFLSYILKYLKHYNVKQVVLSTGYLSDIIINHFQNNYKDILITYSNEILPLGTGGGVRLAMEKCNANEILVLNGDSFFDIDLNKFYNQHHLSNSNFTLALRKVENASRYGTIHLEDNIIKQFKEKNNEHTQGLINAGIYILNKNLYLNNTAKNIPFSIEKDFFEKNTSTLNIHGFEYNDYFIDIGIPEDYLKAQNDFKRFKY
ncbi:MAG: nucleotidyltransferase family protein [Bacteroidetes bacterium]|nr:nucleotidyltransferase family protein [Bacteroidota bacterium]